MGSATQVNFEPEFNVSKCILWGKIRPKKRPKVGNEAPAELSSIPQQKKSIGPNGTDQKRVGKKAEATLLAGMIDEIFEAFDKSVSQWEILKQNRVDINLMD